MHPTSPNRLAMKVIAQIGIIALLLVIKTDLVCGSKILMIIPLTSVSEKNMFIPLANALGKRGHNVTVGAYFKTKYESENVKEVMILELEKHLDELSDPVEMRRQGYRAMIKMDNSFNIDGCERVFQNKNFQKLNEEKFDLIIVSLWFHYCFYGFIHQQQAPFIIASTSTVLSQTQEYTGFRNPTSFVPNLLGSVRDDMNFSERMFNTVLDHYFTHYMNRNYIPDLEKVYKKYIGSNLPSVDQIGRNVSLIFVNAHISSSTPRPLLPDVIEVGGMHCRPAKPLPKDLNDYLNGSGEDGFIFFSLGSMIKGKNMPEESRRMFLNVFSRLKQRVLWKWETEQMDGLPPNVKLGKWLPQQDILGHPNIKLFISHGGMFSTQEAVYHGVPILGVPIFGDQDMNTHHMKTNGYGGELEFLELSEEKIEKAITELLNNKSFAANVKRQSAIFREQPQTPTERAVFWSEYVIRHKGAHHLRSAARNLNFIQYHSLDVIAFLSLILMTITSIILIVGKKLLRRICGKLGAQKGTPASKITAKKTQ